MRTLDIVVDLGPGAAPAEVEALVTAVRVATDIGLSAELRRVRRFAAEQMKYPTDAELSDVAERFPRDETGPGYRARRHLEVRNRLTEELGDFPPRFRDYWYRWRRDAGARESYLIGTGYERAFESAVLPWQAATSPGLDALDPALYQALVSDQVARLAPVEIVVRELRYRNPFGEVVAGVGAAEKAVKATAGVIETAATIGSRRKIKKAEARVAEETIEDRIEDSRLDLELKRVELRRAQIANDLAQEELLAKHIQNAHALHTLNATASRQALVDYFIVSGQLDEADAIAAADPSDAAALTQFALQPPQLTQAEVPDPDGDDSG